MSKVAVIGASMIKFGNLKDQNLLDLLEQVCINLIQENKLEDTNVDLVLVGNMASAALNHQVAIASALVDRLSLIPAGADKIENGPASGGSAIATGYKAIASGQEKIVIIAGAEKMTHAPGPVVTEVVSSMTHPLAEKIHGVTLPSFAAMLARLYSQKFGLTDSQRLQVAIKNHSNGFLNPYAHFQKEITLEKALSSPIIADPLRLYDCCPRSDGAAALIMMDAELAESYTDTPVYIRGSGQATDLHIVHERPDPLKLNAVKIAAEKTFSQANLTPKDVDIIELHDAFSILEFVQAEQCGFFEDGTYAKALEEGIVARNGELPVNVSGGLKARGHPLGATGVAQACEIVWHLQNKAGPRQVKDPKVGFTCNFGGFGNNVVTHLFSKDVKN